MAIKVKAVERKLKFTKNENDPGVYRYVLGAELYTALNQKKVIREAALRSGVSQGVMQACWDARIIFTPNSDLKEELKATAIQITCYDRNGEVVKRVTSDDEGNVEENEQTPGSDTGSNTSDTGSNTGNTGSNTQGGDNTGGGSTGGDNYHDPDGGTNSDE